MDQELKDKLQKLSDKLDSYRKIANIKRKDSITSDMSNEWHAEITQDAVSDPEKLKAYVQEEAFLCF